MICETKLAIGVGRAVALLAMVTPKSKIHGNIRGKVSRKIKDYSEP